MNIGNQEIGQTNKVYLVVKRQCSLKHNIFMSSYLFENFSTLLNTSLNRCSQSGEKPYGQFDVQ